MRTAAWVMGLILAWPAVAAHALDWGDLWEEGRSSWLHSPDESERTEDEIETDRDSFTNSTTTVDHGRAILETSYSFIDNRRTPDTHSLPELLVRVGVTSRLELRFGWNYEVGGGGSVSGNEGGDDDEAGGIEREDQFLYGLKFAFTEQQGWLPESAWVLQAYTPSFGPETSTQVNVAYVFGWTVRENWKLDAALRYGTASEEGDRFNRWYPSVVLKVPVHERCNVHGEFFGIYTQGRAEERQEAYFSPGVHYLLTPDWEIGVRCGWGLTDDAARFFSNVGLGLRF